MQTFPKFEGVWTHDFGSDPSLIWSSIWQAKCSADAGTMKDEVSRDTACCKKQVLGGGSWLHRKGECRKAGSCSCTEGPSSHRPCGAHFTGEKTSCFGSCSACPPRWASCSRPYSLPDTKTLSSSGTKLPRNWDFDAAACVTALNNPAWLLPSQALCSDLAEPITGCQESFHTRFSEAFRCLRMHRDVYRDLPWE